MTPPLAAIGALVWGALQAGSVLVPAISWSVEEGLTCPTRHQLEAAYARQSPARDGEAPTAEVRVQVQRTTTTALSLQLSMPALHLSQRRDLEVGDSSCHDVAQSIAILVHAWLADLPRPEEDNPLTSLTAPKRPPTGDDGWPPGSSADAPQGLVRVTGVNGTSPSWLALSMGISGGAYLAANGASAPAVALDARLRLTKGITVGLLAAWVADLSADDSPNGSLKVQRQIFGASLGIAIPGVDRLGMHGLGADFVAALIVLHAQAQSFGYPLTVEHDLFDPGLLVGARLQQMVGGSVFLQAQLAGIAFARSYTFTAERPTGEAVPVATLPALALDVGVGVGVQIF